MPDIKKLTLSWPLTPVHDHTCCMYAAKLREGLEVAATGLPSNIFQGKIAQKCTKMQEEWPICHLRRSSINFSCKWISYTYLHLHIIFISSSNHISSPMASRASCSPGSRATKRCSATGMGDPSSHSHAIATRQPPPSPKTQTQQVNDTGPLHQHHPDRHSSPIVHYGVASVASLSIIWNHTILNHSKSDYMRQVHATPSLNFLMSKLTQNPFTIITPRTPSGRLRKVWSRRLQAVIPIDFRDLQRSTHVQGGSVKFTDK